MVFLLIQGSFYQYFPGLTLPIGKNPYSFGGLLGFGSVSWML